jgi:hypothetical protein
MESQGMTPEIWQVCEECGGSGNKDISPLVNVTMWKRCPHCAHSPKPGYRAILYTPEQWEAAGGVLHDEMLVWYKDYMNEWDHDYYGFVKHNLDTMTHNKIIVIATPAITMKDLEET